VCYVTLFSDLLYKLCHPICDLMYKSCRWEGVCVCVLCHPIWGLALQVCVCVYYLGLALQVLYLEGYVCTIG